MPFGFGKKEEPAPFTTDITDRDELEEIRKISNQLVQGEKVLLVAKQSRIRPGGSALTTPNTIFATDRRLLIRNPTMLGMRENVEDIPYDKITSVKLEKGMFSSTIVIRAPGLSDTTRIGRASDLIAWGRGEDGAIDAIPKDKAEKLLAVIRDGMDRAKKAAQPSVQPISVADELAKLARLKEQGVLTEAEFLQMKQELLKKL
jgi:hypothetical protein